MRFLRQVMLNDPGAVEEIRQKFLPESKISFKSCCVHGEEKNPARLDLFTSQWPAYNEWACATFIRNEAGELVLQESERKGRK